MFVEILRNSSYELLVINMYHYVLILAVCMIFQNKVYKKNRPCRCLGICAFESFALWILENW